MEECNDSTFELSALVSSNGDWGETLPHDSLANVGGNKKTDTTAEAVTLLEKLVKHEHHKTSDEELSNDDHRSE